jgi:hypothetical protein
MTTDPNTDLRQRIAEAVERLHETGGLYALDAGEPERIADAVLAVLPPPAGRTAVVLSEAERLMLRHALDLADANVSARPDEYTAADEAALTSLRRLADEAQQQREPSVHGESVAALAGYQPDGRDTWGGEQQPRPAKASAAVDEWRGATELVPDHEVRRLSATGVVGYRQDQGRLLHCLHHKPVPASRWADFHEVTADDLPDGGICVHPRCGADLLAVQPAVDARQDGAQQ